MAIISEILVDSEGGYHERRSHRRSFLTPGMIPYRYFARVGIG